MSDTLKDAYISFTKKRYSEVIRILEPQVFRFRDNHNFFYLLGMSCLHQGDYGGAFSYLRRAVDLKENDINVLLGLAAVYLKRGDSANALRLWLDIIEIEPGNAQAQRGLNYLKKNNDAEEFTSLAADEKINRFLPVHKQAGKTPVLPFILIILLLGVAAVFIIPSTRTYILGVFSFSDESRPGVSDVVLDERKDYLNLEGEHPYTLTEKEIEKKFRSIQDYLYEYRDNIAQREINMILLSNASEYVKDRARVLERYIQQPRLTDFKDNFSYAEVTADPALYRNCYVLWKGKTTNLEESSESINFDFLVGYHEEKTLDGILHVSFDFAVRIIPDEPIELLAKVITAEDGSISLKGVSIRRLAP